MAMLENDVSMVSFVRSSERRGKWNRRTNKWVLSHGTYPI